MSEETPPSDPIPHPREDDTARMRAALDEARRALAEGGRRHEDALRRAEARVDRLESQVASLRERLGTLTAEAARLRRRNHELERRPAPDGGGAGGGQEGAAVPAGGHRTVTRAEARRVQMVERARQLTRVGAILALQRAVGSAPDELRDVDEG